MGLEDETNDGQPYESANARPASKRSILGRVKAAKDELQRFVQEVRLADDDDDDEENKDEVATKVRRRNEELHWWWRHQFAFPCLERLAVTYLGIPPSSASSERVFSIAGGIVTKRRNRLGDDTIDALVFLNGSHVMPWESGVSQDALGRVGHSLQTVLVQ